MDGVERGPGRVVVLNGGSSAGKTTLARALQSALPEPWLLLGIDLFIWTLPPEMVGDPDGLCVDHGRIHRGARFLALYEAFRRAVAAFAHNGASVVLDDVMLEGGADQRRWDEDLRGLDACWVGLRCSPEIAADREAARGSRLPGTARHQAESVHAGVRYDVEVDSGAMDLAEEMAVIGSALTKMWSLPLSHSFEPSPQLPITPAWSPGENVRPPFWER